MEREVGRLFCMLSYEAFSRDPVLREASNLLCCHAGLIPPAVVVPVCPPPTSNRRLVVSQSIYPYKTNGSQICMPFTWYLGSHLDLSAHRVIPKGVDTPSGSWLQKGKERTWQTARDGCKCSLVIAGSNDFTYMKSPKRSALSGKVDASESNLKHTIHRSAGKPGNLLVSPAWIHSAEAEARDVGGEFHVIRVTDTGGSSPFPPSLRYRACPTPFGLSSQPSTLHTPHLAGNHPGQVLHQVVGCGFSVGVLWQSPTAAYAHAAVLALNASAEKFPAISVTN
jgi:hypothetical protein